MFPSACVILPAAGIGVRMGLATPKQYWQLSNRPLISYTIEAFENIQDINHIFVVASADRLSELHDILKTHLHQRVSVVVGAATRHRSIWNGVSAAVTKFPDIDVLVIHDAVRPFVDEDTIRNVISAAAEHGAAGVIRPLVSTVISSDSIGFLDHSLDRTKYHASEMPQAFRRNIIATAYDKCSEYDLDFGTECLHLAQKYSAASVRLLQGSDNLWKVTHRRDLYSADGLIKEGQNSVLVVSSWYCECEPLSNSDPHCMSNAIKERTNACSESTSEIDISNERKYMDNVVTQDKFLVDIEFNCFTRNTHQCNKSNEECDSSRPCEREFTSSSFRKLLQVSLNKKHSRNVSVLYRCYSCFMSKSREEMFPNNVVFVHLSSEAIEALSNYTERTCSLVGKGAPVSLVHIFSSLTSEGQNRADLLDQAIMQSIKKAEDKVCNLQNVTVNGMILYTNDKCHKLVDIIASLIFEHNKLYSGQTFFV